MRVRKVHALGACGLTLGVLLGAPALAQAAQPCKVAGPISAELVESGGAIERGIAASYERAGDGSPRRTLYLANGAYLVTVCRPNGEVVEQQSMRVPTSDGGTVYRVVTTARAKGGRAQVQDATLPSPIDVTPKAQAASSRLSRLAAATEMGPAASRTRQRRLGPGSADLLTRYRSRLSPSAKRRHEVRAAWLGNRCIHNSWGSSGRWPGRNIVFSTAIGANWQRTRISDGVWTWTGVLNDCGFAQAPQAVWATWAGEIQHLAVQADGSNQVGWWWSQGCGATTAIGCAITNRTWDPVAQKWNIWDVDMWFYVHWPWSSDGSCGGGTTTDLWSVAAHEWGHAYGATHVTDFYSQDLIMYPTIESCQTHKRNLGYGDNQFLRNTYP